jgi:trimeric autotransporter adhesin
VTGGSASTGTVTLSGAAPTGGITVALQSSNTGAATVPASVTVAAGASSAPFTVTTSAVTAVTTVTITGSFNGGTQTATLTVNPPSGSGQIALVQQTTATYTSASSVVATLGAAPGPGSALVLFSVNNSVVVTGVSGGGVTWVRGSPRGGTHTDVDIWYGLNSSGVGTAITVAYTNATGSGGVNVSEFSGVATSNALDVAPAINSGLSTTPTSPTAVTTNANDLIVVAAADTTVSATTAGPTNSFIALAEAANSNKIIPAYSIVTTTGSYSTSWTEGNGGWDSAIVALK